MSSNVSYLPVLTSRVLGLIDVCLFDVVCTEIFMELYACCEISLLNRTIISSPARRILKQEFAFTCIFFHFCYIPHISTQLYPDMSTSATEICLVIFQPVNL